MVTGEKPTGDETKKITQLSDASVMAAVTPTNPNTFPVRGRSGGDSSYWIEAKNIIAGRFCDDTSCGSDTDRITQTTTYNPGTVASRFDTKYLYSPNSGAFTNWTYRLFAGCSGVICDSERISKPPKSKSYVLNDDGNRKGKVLTLAVGLEVYSGRWTYDGSKTKDCKGSTKSKDNRCWYQWDKA